MIYRFIKMARRFLGYEQELNGNTVFGKLYALQHGDEFKTAAWCMMFIWTVARLCGIDYDQIPDTASCPTLLQWAKDKHRLKSTPRVGDICIFKLNKGDIASHVGIVTEVDDEGKCFMTIEGNRKHTTGSKLPWVGEDRWTGFSDSIVVGFVRWL